MINDSQSSHQFESVRSGNRSRYNENVNAEFQSFERDNLSESEGSFRSFEKGSHSIKIPISIKRESINF